MRRAQIRRQRPAARRPATPDAAEQDLWTLVVGIPRRGGRPARRRSTPSRARRPA